MILLRGTYSSTKRSKILGEVTFLLRLWNYAESAHPAHTWNHHSGFVYGLDIGQDWIVDCAWDKTLKVFPNRMLLKNHL